MGDDHHEPTFESLLAPYEVMGFADPSDWLVDFDNILAALSGEGASNSNIATDNSGHQFGAQNSDQFNIGQDTNGESLFNSRTLEGHPSGNGFEPPSSTSSRVAYPEEVHSSLFAQPPIVGTNGQVQNSSMGVMPSSNGYYVFDSDGVGNNFFAPPAAEYKDSLTTEPYPTTNSPDSSLSDLSQALPLWQGISDSPDVVAPQQNLPLSYNGFEQAPAHFKQPINSSVVSDNLDQSGYCEVGQSNAYNMQTAQSLPFNYIPSVQKYMDGSRFIQTPFESVPAAVQDTSAPGSRSTESFNGQIALGDCPQIPVYNLPPEATWIPPVTLSDSTTSPELWLPNSQVPIETPAPELCAQSVAKHTTSTGKLKRAHDQFTAAHESTCDPYHHMPTVASDMSFDMNPWASSYSPTAFPQAVPHIATHNVQLQNVDVPYPWDQPTTSSSQMPTQSYANPAAYVFGTAGESTLYPSRMGQESGQETANVSGSDGTATQADKFSHAYHTPNFPFTFVSGNGMSLPGPSSFGTPGQALDRNFELHPNEQKSGSQSGGRKAAAAAKIAKKKRILKPQTENVPIETSPSCKWGGACNIILKDGKKGSYRSHLQEHHFADFPPECIGNEQATSDPARSKSKSLTINWTMKKVVKCRWENCGQDLGLESLARHIGTYHTRSLCRRCEICGRLFSRVDALRRHLVVPDPRYPHMTACPLADGPLTDVGNALADGDSGEGSEGCGFLHGEEQPCKKQRCC